MLIIILLLITGFLATKYFFIMPNLLCRIGMIIFFSISIVPFLNINLALFKKIYVSNEITLLSSIISCIVFSGLILSKRNKAVQFEKNPFIPKDELFVLIIAVVSVFFLSLYYSNKEFLLSLGSYLIKGDAACFYMQTFETIDYLRADFKGGMSNNIYEIICTPGNILFSSTLVPIFKINSFKILYVIFLLLLFLFTYLLIKKLLNNHFIALITAFFSLFNPYVLSVEVLDRNVMALAVSVIFIYLILEYEDKTFLHGLVFGILSGTGLRFIPLLFILPALMAYRKKGLSPSGYLLFLLAFMITFTFNLPHLYFHGFNSLGESSSSFLLAKEAFSGWERTPFLPFPNLIFYLIDILNYFGYLFSIIILAGLFNLWKNERKYFLFFSAIFLVILLILSVQKNWIEGDKYRIIICSFLSLLVFFAYGLKYIFTVKKNFKRYLLLLLFLIILSLFSQLSNKFDFKDDTEFYTRKFLYQTESPSYYRLAKKYLTDIGLLPNYKRLYSKLDIRQKRKEEAIILKRLFPEGGFPGLDKFGLFYAQWEKTLYKSLEPSFKKRVPGCYNYIKINFEKLADNLYSPVEKVKNAEIEAIDLKNIDTSIFNVYYANLSVSWQKEKLPVAVILNEDELDYLKELYIDLNAFISLDTGPAVFEKVYPINFKSRKLLGKQVPGLGMETFPLYSERNTIIFHVPSDLKIVIRNWFVNEKGNPYKIDSWIITPDKNGNYRKEFNYNEPESYL